MFKQPQKLDDGRVGYLLSQRKPARGEEIGSRINPSAAMLAQNTGAANEASGNVPRRNLPPTPDQLTAPGQQAGTSRQAAGLDVPGADNAGGKKSRRNPTDSLPPIPGQLTTPEQQAGTANEASGNVLRRNPPPIPDQLAEPGQQAGTSRQAAGLDVARADNAAGKTSRRKPTDSLPPIPDQLTAPEQQSGTSRQAAGLDVARADNAAGKTSRRKPTDSLPPIPDQLTAPGQQAGTSRQAAGLDLARADNAAGKTSRRKPTDSLPPIPDQLTAPEQQAGTSRQAAGLDLARADNAADKTSRRKPTDSLPPIPGQLTAPEQQAETANEVSGKAPRRNPPPIPDQLAEPGQQPGQQPGTSRQAAGLDVSGTDNAEGKKSSRKPTDSLPPIPGQLTAPEQQAGASRLPPPPPLSAEFLTKFDESRSSSPDGSRKESPIWRAPTPTEKSSDDVEPRAATKYRFDNNNEIRNLLGDLVGEGTFGKVYQDKSDPNFVIKEFKKNDITEQRSLSDEAERFVDYYGHDSAEIIHTDDGMYLKMKKIPGVPMSDVKSYPEGAAEAFQRMRTKMEEAGIQHADVRPENFMYSEKTNEFFPIDLGRAGYTDSELRSMSKFPSTVQAYDNLLDKISGKRIGINDNQLIDLLGKASDLHHKGEWNSNELLVLEKLFPPRSAAELYDQDKLKTVMLDGKGLGILLSKVISSFKDESFTVKNLDAVAKNWHKYFDEANPETPKNNPESSAFGLNVNQSSSHVAPLTAPITLHPDSTKQPRAPLGLEESRVPRRNPPPIPEQLAEPGQQAGTSRQAEGQDVPKADNAGSKKSRRKPTVLFELDL